MFRLGDELLSLGRSATNTLCLPEDDGLSRQHLVIEKEDGRWGGQESGEQEWDVRKRISH